MKNATGKTTAVIVYIWERRALFPEASKCAPAMEELPCGSIHNMYQIMLN
jgi:hypothetical protein